MSSHASTPPAAVRLRGGTWRYAVPSAAGAGAAKFRENLRALGGEDLMGTSSTVGAAADGAAPGRRAPRDRGAR